MVFRISGIKGEGDKGSEILNPKYQAEESAKRQSKKRHDQHAELEVFLHFALYFCFFTFAFWCWYFSLGILVLI